MATIKHTFILSAILLLLSACGGGGGDEETPEQCAVGVTRASSAQCAPAGSGQIGPAPSCTPQPNGSCI